MPSELELMTLPELLALHQELIREYNYLVIAIETEEDPYAEETMANRAEWLLDQIAAVNEAIRDRIANPVPPVAVPIPVPDPPPVPGDGGVFGPVYEFLGDLWNGIIGTLGGQLQDARTALLTALNPLSAVTMATWYALSEPGSSFYQRIDALMGDRLPDDLGDIGPGIAGLRDQLVDVVTSDIPAAISGAQEGVASFLGQGLENFFRSSGGLIGDVLGGAATAFLDLMEKPLAVFLRPFIQSLRDAGDIPEAFQPILDEMENPTQYAVAPLIMAALAGGAAALLANVGRGITAPLQWRVNAQFRPQLLGQGDIQLLWWRYPQDEDYFLQQLAYLGVTDDKAVWLAEAARRWPFTRDLQQMVNLGMIDEEPAKLELQNQGYHPYYANYLINLRRQYPGVSDVIRFGVREATRQDVVDEYQLDSDFPPGVNELAARIGLHEDDVQLYWRAHWELPSISQAFDMYHRTTQNSTDPGADTFTLPDGSTVQNVIGGTTLKSLLQYQDVMPFWRDKLTAIAFTPFTRVDIRRLFRTAVFDLSDVVRAYLDIGYSPENALIQAQFVDALDRETHFNRALPELRQQARLGLLEGQALLDRASQFAPDPASAEEAVELLELDVRGERFREILSAYRQALRTGRLTPAQFRVEAAALEISSSLIDHMVLVETVRTQEDQAGLEQIEARAAGRGVAVRRFREGLIDDDGFNSEMASLGYTDAETERYLDIARLEFDTNWRLDLVQAALTAFRQGHLSLTELSERLDAIGIDPELRDAYLDREVARIRVEDPAAQEVELRATGSGIVTRRYREGWTSPAMFAGEMAMLGYSTVEIDRYQLIADLEFDYDWRQDILALYRGAFSEGVIDAFRFASDLTAFGMDPDRVQTHLARLTVAEGLQPITAP